MDLLERDAFLEELDELLRDAAGGQGRLALVGGEAGIGKTALVGHFAQTVSVRGRARVLFGACDPLSTPRPLGPLQDIAAQVGGELDRLLAADAPRDRLFRACLAELSGGLTPTVAIIEDVHWADEATLDLLRFLGRRVQRCRTLLAVTYRDDEVGAVHPLRLVLGDLATTGTVRRLSLPSLSERAVRSLVVGSGSPVDAGELHRLTGGNPFYVTEVLATGKTGLPASIRDAVLARVGRLPAGAKAVLEAAAVGGPAVAPDLLAAVAGATTDAIDACIDAGMLQERARELAFRHELAREAVLSVIFPPRRIALHARVLQELETASAARRYDARLAHHAEAAGDQRAVLEYAPLAARQAASLRAHREAAAQYERALRFAGDLPDAERARLLEASAYECYLTDQHEAAIAARREALSIWRAEHQSVKIGENLRWLSRLSWFVGRREEAEATAQEAIAVLAETGSNVQLAWAYSNLAQLLMLSSEGEAARAWAERAIALADETGEREITVHALSSLGSILDLAGRGQGRPYLELSLKLALELGLEEHVARAWTNLACGAVGQQEFALADRYLQGGISYATEHDLDSWRLFLTASRAEVRLYLGDWDGAADDAASLIARPGVALVTRMPALEFLGRVKIRRGEPDAMVVLDEALALAVPMTELQWQVTLRAARAEAADLAGDRRRVLAEVQAIFDLADRRGSPMERGELVYWRWRSGVSPGHTGPIAEPFALQIAGEWRRAAAAWDERDCPYEAARARTEGEDEAELRAALATFERLGARPMAALTTRRLRELGARAIPRGPRPATRANPANLTPREIDVLSLVAAGLRNAEIAERLYLSAKTVDHHVAAILTKLGVHSRTDAVTAANRLGIPIGVGQDREPDLAR